MIGAAVYALCALTSFACALLLWRGYRRSRTRLLLWSSLCFWGLFLNNAMLFIDITLLPHSDLLLLRHVPALAGVGALVYGLVWEADA
jgi:hypothetical protein